jgi:hypothetical protein
MNIITIDYLQENFDIIMNRVENGDSFLIHSENGNAMPIPHNDNKESDDLIRIHTEHFDAC